MFINFTGAPQMSAMVGAQHQHPQHQPRCARRQVAIVDWDTIDDGGSVETTPRQNNYRADNKAVSPPNRVAHLRAGSAPGPTVQGGAMACSSDSILFEFMLADELESDLELVRIEPAASVLDLLRAPLLRRKVNQVDKVLVFLEGSSTPLPLISPVVYLAGRKLYVRDCSGSACAPGAGSRNCAKSNSFGRMKGDSNDSGGGTSLSSASETDPPLTLYSGGGTQPPQSFSLQTSASMQAPARKASLPHVMAKASSFMIRTPVNRTRAANPHGSAATLAGATGAASEPISPLAQSTTDSVADGSDAGECGDTSGPVAASLGTGADTLRARRTTRIGALFGNQKNDLLCRLAAYREQGMASAARASMVDLAGSLVIEEHWTKIVDDADRLTKKENEQQESLWELVTTENSYIQMLAELTDVHQYLLNLQTEGFLRDVEPMALFHNISDVYRANMHFWTSGVVPVLERARATAEPLDAAMLKDGFEDIDRWCHAYIRFNLEFFSMLYYLQRKQKESELFRDFVTWVQTLPMCRRLKLEDLLASPMQRLTRYPLMLKTVLKNTRDTTTRDALTLMIDKCECAVMRVNFELSYKQQVDTLIRVQQSIEAFDCVDCNNDELERMVRQNSRFDLTSPMPFCRSRVMRKLLLRGELKLKDGYSRLETMCYLFTDMFLVCKASRQRGRFKAVRPPYFIERIVVRLLTESVGFALMYVNEYGLPAAAYVFQTPSLADAEKWLEYFHVARREYRHQKESLDPMAAMGGPVMSPPSRVTIGGAAVAGAEFGAAAVEVGDISPHPAALPPPTSNASFAGGTLPEPETVISHRKAASMDSTVIAASGGRLSSPVSSAALSPAGSAARLDAFGLATAEQQLLRPPSCGLDDASVTGKVRHVKRRRPHSREILDCRPSRELASPVSHPYVEFETDDGEATTSSPDNLDASEDTCGEDPLPVGDESHTDMSCDDVATADVRAGATTDEEEGLRCCASPPVFVLQHDGAATSTPLEINGNDFTEGELTRTPLGSQSDSTIVEGSRRQSSEHALTLSPSSRRLERRYYTADLVEQMKPTRPAAYPSSILKRFSLNVSNAVNGTSRKAGRSRADSHAPGDLCPNMRAAAAAGSDAGRSSTRKSVSHTNMSSDSFSSTSGVSSSSSQYALSEQLGGTPAGVPVDSHVSTVHVNELHSSAGSTANAPHALRISLLSSEEHQQKRRAVSPSDGRVCSPRRPLSPLARSTGALGEWLEHDELDAPPLPSLPPPSISPCGNDLSPACPLSPMPPQQQSAPANLTADRSPMSTIMETGTSSDSGSPAATPTPDVCSVAGSVTAAVASDGDGTPPVKVRGGRQATPGPEGIAKAQAATRADIMVLLETLETSDV